MMGKWNERVSWCCAWCGEEDWLKPSEAKKKECCSKSCASKLKAKRAGKNESELLMLACDACGKQKQTTKRNASTKYRKTGRYLCSVCSRDAYLLSVEKLRSEVSALTRIKKNIQRWILKNKRIREKKEIQPERLNKIYHCLSCGIEVVPPIKKCKKCKDKTRRKQKHKDKVRRRSLKRSTQIEAIDPIDVFRRDGWRCHICGKKTLKTKRGTCHDKAPEIDHIVSLAHGGAHIISNVACSCRRCNGVKGARSFGQLVLGYAC